MFGVGQEFGDIITTEASQANEAAFPQLEESIREPKPTLPLPTRGSILYHATSLETPFSLSFAESCFRSQHPGVRQ